MSEAQTGARLIAALTEEAARHGADAPVSVMIAWTGAWTGPGQAEAVTTRIERQTRSLLFLAAHAHDGAGALIATANSVHTIKARLSAP